VGIYYYDERRNSVSVVSLKITRLNESYSQLDGSINELKSVSDFLKVERPNAFFDPLVKSGFKSPYEYFTVPHNDGLVVLNGHVPLLGVHVEPELSDYTEKDVDDFIESIDLPFEPYDFQIKAFKESVMGCKQINKCCTGSGKSCIIFLLCMFFRQHNMKGIILVPTISLLNQIYSDMEDYLQLSLYNKQLEESHSIELSDKIEHIESIMNDIHLIGGGNVDMNLDSSITISTWQSMKNYDGSIDVVDFVICDECHRFASEVTSDIVSKTVNCKYKFGFTGTLPEDPTYKMQLVGLFGMPKTYITSRELIDRGLGTPVNIHAVTLTYGSDDKNMFKGVGTHPKKLQFVKEHIQRNEFIVNLGCKLMNVGNTLLLFQHTNHGKELFTIVMKQLFPDVIIKNKDIVGKKSFEFQQQYHVYFINGEDDSVTREKTRCILEEDTKALLVANYAILSTGVNIKRLHNMILGSPLKSYTTVTQSIGRLMRLHKDKKEANVFDLIDDFSVKGGSGPFVRQYKHRVNTSYNPEEFPIREITIQLT